MTDALFLAEFEQVRPGEIVRVTGDEGHHAVAVKRIAVGETVLLSNGRGSGARGVVVSAGKRELCVEVTGLLEAADVPFTWTLAQGLAKGERSELAVQGATELGVRRIIAWQASRSIVRWQGERGEKALEKWRSTAREAAKQSRRLWVPEVTAASTAKLNAAIAGVDVALVLHEDAPSHIAELRLPERGTGLLIVGPEGGISGDELAGFIAAGARAVNISDGVLRTSTSGAVALGQLDVIQRRP